MNKKATTLIELIISITIAIILMGAIGVFVSSGMQNLFLQQSSIENLTNIYDFSNDLQKTFNSIENSGQVQKIGSGIILKRKKVFDRGVFSYIGTNIENKFFCKDNKSEDTKTNHIYIKNFIPFFEEGENNLDQTLTAEVGNYTSYQKEHKIEKNGEIIIGKGVFGDEFKDGEFGTGIYLNSPTGLTTDNEGKLYFSDTLNNRILYLSGSKVYKLLNFDDGLREPSGLFFDDNEKAIYISNSKIGEIWKLSSKKYNIFEEVEMNLAFSGVELENIFQINIKFLNTSGSTNLDLPTNISDLEFSGISRYTNEDFLTGATNNLKYFFNDFSKELENNEIYDCPSSGNFIIKEAYLDHTPNLISKKQIKECPSSGTGNLVTYGNINFVNFYNINEYKIKVKNIKINSETKPGNYYVKLEFYDKNGEKKYEKIFPFFTNGDNKIYTLEDNILETYKKNLNYPNGIWGKSDDDYNEFKDYNNYNYKIDKKNDIILETPIKDLKAFKNSNLINIILKYYRNYNCYNLGENENKIQTFLFKKNLK